MSDTMQYKGFTGSVEYSAEDNLLFGRLVGIRDRILFDGEDVRTLKENFYGAVDAYLAFCKSEGKIPDKPFKGSLNIRIPSDLHRNLTLVAEQTHKSLNSIIAERLAASLHSLDSTSLAQTTLLKKGAVKRRTSGHDNRLPTLGTKSRSKSLLRKRAS